MILRIERKGFRFDTYNSRNKRIAEVAMDGDYSSDYTFVNERYRHKGIATKMYDFIELSLGIKMRPSNCLTDSGWNLWVRRDASALKGTWVTAWTCFDEREVKTILKCFGYSRHDSEILSHRIGYYNVRLDGCKSKALLTELSKYVRIHNICA